MLSLIAAYQIAKQDGAFGPDVSAQSAIVIDATTGKPLWERAADVKRYPASTTKIMTAMLLIEHSMQGDIIVAPNDVTKIQEASMHLKPKERVSVQDMLYAVMLRSANDGSYAVANHVSGSVEKFAKTMNDRAKIIGCSNTSFRNPNGLHDPQHYTTARDMATIAREAMKNPVFREVVRTQSAEISRSANQQDLVMQNKNRSLKYDPTADGIKTGYTRPAGRCFVGSATRDGFRLITCVFRSNDVFADNKKLLDWAYKNFSQRELAPPDSLTARVQMDDGQTQEISLNPATTLQVLVRKGIEPAGSWRHESAGELRSPIELGARVGNLVYRDEDGFEVRVPAIASNVENQTNKSSKRASLADFGTLLFGGMLAACAWWMRKKAIRI